MTNGYMRYRVKNEEADEDGEDAGHIYLSVERRHSESSMATASASGIVSGGVSRSMASNSTHFTDIMDSIHGGTASMVTSSWNADDW